MEMLMGRGGAPVDLVVAAPGGTGAAAGHHRFVGTPEPGKSACLDLCRHIAAFGGTHPFLLHRKRIQTPTVQLAKRLVLAIRPEWYRYVALQFAR